MALVFIYVYSQQWKPCLFSIFIICFLSDRPETPLYLPFSKSSLAEWQTLQSLMPPIVTVFHNSSPLLYNFAKRWIYVDTSQFPGHLSSSCQDEVVFSACFALSVRKPSTEPLLSGCNAIPTLRVFLFLLNTGHLVTKNSSTFLKLEFILIDSDLDWILSFQSPLFAPLGPRFFVIDSITGQWDEMVNRHMSLTAVPVSQFWFGDIRINPQLYLFPWFPWVFGVFS